MYKIVSIISLQVNSDSEIMYDYANNAKTEPDSLLTAASDKSLVNRPGLRSQTHSIASCKNISKTRQ